MCGVRHLRAIEDRSHSSHVRIEIRISDEVDELLINVLAIRKKRDSQPPGRRRSEGYADSSHSANSVFPYLRATSAGVMPSAALASRNAPWDRRSFAISTSPRLAAPWRGV